MMTHRLGAIRLTTLAAVLALGAPLMVSASAPPAGNSPRSFTERVQALPLVPPDARDSEMLTQVSATVSFIQHGQLAQAQQAVNAALQLDPLNSYLHFLNGFVYHLQARQGDTEKNEMALEGYQQALRINPGNWIAEELMGLAYLEQKQFDRARLAFSNVLLMTPDSAVSLYGLMVASYLTGDARTACAMADQYLKEPKAPDPGFVRSSVAVYASCGHFEQAERMRAMLQAQDKDGFESKRVERRLAQWKSFYQSQAQPAGPAAAVAGMLPASYAQAPMSTPAIQLAQAFTMPPPPMPAATPAATAAVDDASAADAPAPVVNAAPAAEQSGTRMVLIDVVLLSTQELISTSKGVNLLSALTLQLGSATNNLPAWSRVFSTDSTGNGSTAITRAVSIPALAYSLNIANANSSVNEVLARPTLAAIEGLSSDFFSGTNLSAGVVSTSTQGGTTVVPVDKRFGIKLAVTPTFLAQGQVQLKVEAQRTALNPAADNPRVAYQIEIGEVTANANVVMRLGETLVLSGLSEKSTSSTRDGVPVLQNIPGLQYLFSKKQTNNVQRSVLILVTPRAPVQVAGNPAEAAASMSSRMKDLRERFGFTEPAAPNVDAIMNQMQSKVAFREFRQGDVSMEQWDRMDSIVDRLREALGFLYY